MLKLARILNNPKITSWLEDYLTSRRFFVSLGGACSEPADVLSWVPQGSVLGPLLFLIFINDVEKFVGVDMRFYADDCILFSEVKNVNDQRLLNRALERLSEWCTTWQLPLNVGKCVQMTFSRKLSPLSFSYHINNNPLQSVSTYKYLGVIFSADLKWNLHVDSVVRKAYGKLR